jgi:hypothetical protein
MAMADPIPNEELHPADVPQRGADWLSIVRFAQTFIPYLQSAGAARCLDVANHRRDCETLSDLRACLYGEYRRYNHAVHLPDAQTMAHIYDLLDRIREQASAG